MQRRVAGTATRGITCDVGVIISVGLWVRERSDIISKRGTCFFPQNLAVIFISVLDQRSRTHRPVSDQRYGHLEGVFMADQELLFFSPSQIHTYIHTP